MRCTAALTIVMSITLSTLIVGCLVEARSVTGGAVVEKGQKDIHTGDEGHLLVQPEDVAAFGEVIITSPEHPLERGTTVIQGWQDAHSIAIGVASLKPGQYAAEIISSSYRFSSPQAAQAALMATLAAREATAMDGRALLDEKLVQLLDTDSAIWRVWYWTDEVGLLNYSFVFQLDSSVVNISLTTFSTIVAADLPDNPSASHEEQVYQYIEALTGRMDAGQTFEQLVDTETAHTFGERLLNGVVERLIKRGLSRTQ